MLGVNQNLPTVISYGDLNGLEVRPREPVGFLSCLVRCWLAFVITIRNAFFFPMYNKMGDDDERVKNERLAGRISCDLQNLESSCSKKVAEIRRYFSVRNVEVNLTGEVVRTFTVRLFESKETIRDKKLRVILFTFNGNKEHPKERPMDSCRWNPLNIKELSTSPLIVLKAFQEGGIKIDSLVTNSLGNVALSGLSRFADIVPQTIIINRGIPSVKKVTNQHYPFPLNHILYGVAKLSGWDADPERDLVKFTKNGSQRKVIVIEAQQDFYFSGENGFASNFPRETSLFHARFFPYPIQSRAHHAIPLNHVTNNSETKVLANTVAFQLQENEKMSSALAKNIFLGGREEWHTCFYIGGADCSLNVGTVRDVMPLLTAFIAER